ncbi:hypothetical protein pdam_00001622, partial [Pocillopora damicornis]
TRTPSQGNNIGKETTNVLARSKWKQIQQKRVSSHDAFHFTLQSDQFAHAQQSATFKVEEIMKNSERFENYVTTAMKSS